MILEIVVTTYCKIIFFSLGTLLGIATIYSTAKKRIFEKWAYFNYLNWLRINSFVISFVFVSATRWTFSISIPIVIVSIPYRTVCCRRRDTGVRWTLGWLILSGILESVSLGRIFWYLMMRWRRSIRKLKENKFELPTWLRFQYLNLRSNYPSKCPHT